MFNSTPTYLKTIALMTGFNLLILLIRNQVVGNQVYNFLLWNLFLGFAPLLVAWILNRYYEDFAKWLLVLGSLGWLFFYPNAPYMISDLIHVNEGGANLVIYDTLIIFSFAMLSIFYGFLSLKIMYSIFQKWKGKSIANAALVISLLLSSLGFYLGRVVRLNSWDIFTDPLKVAKEILANLWPIGDNLTTYAVMFLFGGIQYMLLVMMRDINSLDNI